MADLNALMAQIREAISQHGTGWLQEQLQGDPPVQPAPSTPAPVRSSARRPRAPARLSPEDCPQPRRHRRSPSRDPRVLAATRTAGGESSGTRRNPTRPREQRTPGDPVLPTPIPGRRGSGSGGAAPEVAAAVGRSGARRGRSTRRRPSALPVSAGEEAQLSSSRGDRSGMPGSEEATPEVQARRPSWTARATGDDVTDVGGGASGCDASPEGRGSDSDGDYYSPHPPPERSRERRETSSGSGLQSAGRCSQESDRQQRSEGPCVPRAGSGRQMARSTQCVTPADPPAPARPGELTTTHTGGGVLRGDIAVTLAGVQALLQNIQDAVTKGGQAAQGVSPAVVWGSQGEATGAAAGGGPAPEVIATEGTGDKGQDKGGSAEKKKTGEEIRLSDAARGELYACFEGPLGVHLKQDVREKIWKGEYVEIFSLLPLDKFNLDRVKPEESKKEEEERRRYRLIPRTFNNWLQAFAILASVIGEKAPENCSALFCYMDSIGEAYRVYGGTAWLRYDEHFRQRKAMRPNLRWDHKDIGLWMRLMAAPRSTNAQPFREGAGGFGPASGRSASFGKGCCWQYNEGTCRFGTDCRYKHECSGCGGAHGLHRCFKKGKGKGGEADTKGGDTREGTKDAPVPRQVPK